MTALRLALVGAPNCGKSTLFNGLTGGRAKVANYAGATVETRLGRFSTPGGLAVELVDLPGVYGLSARSRDEQVALAAMRGQADGLPEPDALLVVVDAGDLRTHLHTVLLLRALGRPIIVALNMIDLAERDGVKLDVAELERRLGAPVVATRATRKGGRDALLARLDAEGARLIAAANAAASAHAVPGETLEPQSVRALQGEARALAQAVILHEPAANRLTRVLDQVALHPIAGPILLAGILFFMFQAVYAWSALPMDAIDGGVGALAGFLEPRLAEGWFKSLVLDGVIAGVGSVIIFLPQIIILFAFILVLEGSGYMARAAFLMDEVMRRAGLSGRAFIPLLSSFACAIPGIMAARTIESERDRITTIMVAPLMTCTAQLQIYTVLIAAFIPAQQVGFLNLQGLVLFGLYAFGVIAAVLAAALLKGTALKGGLQPLLMELPTYKLPEPRDFFLGLWTRAAAFVRRAGTIIFATSVVLWFLVSYPAGAEDLRGTYAGMIGSVLEPVFRPIGFSLEMVIALVPGLAAREVAIAALGAVYAVHGEEDAVFAGVQAILPSVWSLPTALAFLAWYVFAPQCLATLAVTKRETNSWGWTAFMAGYLFALAYVAAGLTYWIARAAGL